jgi:CHAT domain-containing protein
VEVASPRYAALTQTPKFTADDINALLGPDTLLLEYALGREQSYLWAVTAQETRAFTLPPRSQIETQARHCYDAWATGKMPTDGAADKLSQMLLGPASRLLGRKRLLIVGEGMLQYVPFAALPEPDTAAPLIVRHEITTLPSALTLAALRRETVKRNAPQQLTAFILADPVFDANDPRVTKSDATQTPSALPRTLNDLRTVSRAGLSRLPATRAEAQALSKLLPPAQRLVTLDFAANYAAVTDPSLSNYRILHFATHGIFDATRPELSGLALSLVDAQGRPQNGFLWAHEIYNLNLPAELVVLSACRTALGQDVKGEGLMSLTRGFMYAGAARVVASLWEVNDPATAALMADFYKNMLRRRMRPAAALRAAQIAAWRKRLAPHLWAAFTIQGEYR